MKNLISINEEYQAGLCNIGPAEIKKRKNYFYLSLVGTIIFVLFLILAPISQTWLLLAFFPFFATMVNYLQVRNKFCVAFGYLSVVNFGDKSNRQRITNTDNHKADLKKIQLMFLQSILISLLATIILYFVIKMN